MIKGVNRQIIEVSDTGNLYYEKAWLVVRSQYSNTPKETLEAQAKTLIKEMDTPSSIKRKGAKGYFLVRMGLSAFAGSLITLFAQMLMR